MPKTIVITGASDGIGAAGARRLSADGHTVVVVGRSPEKTAAIAAELGVESHVADFTRLDDVRELAGRLRSRHQRIDVLVNNAGGVFGDRTPTADGFEKTLQVNHLAPFLLTDLLLDVLISSRATIVATSSIAARLYGHLDLDDLGNARRYSANKAYGDAKLANILTTRALHDRFHGDGLAAAAFHPGVVATGFASDTTSTAMKLVYANPLARRFIAGPDRGADQLVWLSTSAPGTDWRSGEYYEKRSVASRVNPQSRDDDLARRLFDVSSDLVRAGS
ncbi:SDR family NAD(P)-dependent oxidoreductase [Kineococcus rubinsiae]|uniref:SDR family NAD(P)-dependent oxidoreductase n=1 Tax=Kineococcus rubinsiae TaxID=2609562 RepID=UPI0014300E27|nr:SDR family NAD(P)-dependent oxidoreductase [Kineococcus rubinsiae]NIZ91375.1 SDR family NAD(P)-dependent oxidoreductase [Kineococcus rubinsiae]